MCCKMARDLGSISTLDALRAEVEAFQGCTLRTAATRTVFSAGNPKARIMLIGEAPGAQEDAQGVPFVGRSGQLLDKMLASIGLFRTSDDPATSVYITNTVFWRPPDNRTPTPAETASCRPFLIKHIALVAPALLVLVGGTAAKAVLQTPESMGRLRRHWHAFDVPGLGAVPTLATFHPAYLLRNPPAKKDAWDDLLFLHDKAMALGVVSHPPAAEHRF